MCNHPYLMYLDDERVPKLRDDYVIVRSFNEAVAYVLEHGLPEFISFDHDLGLVESGYDFAKWLVDYMIDNQTLVLPEWNVHSANPVGAQNINGLLESFKRHLADQ